MAQKMWISMVARKKTEARSFSRATVAVLGLMAEMMNWREVWNSSAQSDFKMKKIAGG